MTTETDAPVKDGIIRIVLSRRQEYTILRAEIIKGGKFSTLAIDRYRHATREQCHTLRQEGIRIARAKKVRFHDEVALIPTVGESRGSTTQAAVLADDHPCVRP